MVWPLIAAAAASVLALLPRTTATQPTGPVKAAATKSPAPVRTPSPVVAPKPVSFLQQLQADLNVLPNQSLVTRQQVERIAQEMQKRYFQSVDWRMITTMAWIESSFNPNAYRFESHLDDASYGLMQTLLRDNALWLYKSKGATAMGRPDAETLRNPIVSIYFGMAYVNWLRTHPSGNRTEEWIVRAYNGGPGWARNTTARAMTLNHWTKYKQAKGRFYG